MPGSHNIDLGTQSGIEFDILERAGYSHLGDLVRAGTGDSLTIKGDFSPVGLIEATYAVEKAGLAGTIRPDYGQNLAVLDVYTYVN